MLFDGEIVVFLVKVELLFDMSYQYFVNRQILDWWREIGGWRVERFTV